MLRLTSRRIDTPPIRRSPGFRARTKNGWLPRADRCRWRVGRTRNVTQPSGPLAASGGVVVLPKGMPTRNTIAPDTEWPCKSLTWKRAETGGLERRMYGEKDSLSTSRRFGSAASLTLIDVPTGAPAFTTTPVGV